MPASRRLSSLCLVLMLASLAGCASVEPLATTTPDRPRAAEKGNFTSEPGDLGIAKTHYRDGQYGLAEKHFRLAVERQSDNVEAWLGLAATHDELGRFDLADREYAQVARKSGSSFELLNNRGYSYMLRGELARARKDFLAAQRLDPDNEFVNNNLRILDDKRAARG